MGAPEGRGWDAAVRRGSATPLGFATRSRSSLASPRLWIMLLALLAVVPAGGLALYAGMEQRRAVAARVEFDAVRLTRVAAAIQKRLVEGTRQLLVVLAALPEVRRGETGTCSALLADLLPHYPGYVNLGVMAPDGALICSAIPPGGPTRVAQPRYVRHAVETRDFVPGEYEIERISGKPAVVFGYPVVDTDGRVQAAAFAALDLGWLNQTAAELPLPERGSLIVVDATGTVVVHNPEPRRWVGMNMLFVPLVHAMLAQGEGAIEGPGVDGLRRFYSFAPVGENSRSGQRSGLFVGVGISREAALAAPNWLLVWHLAGLALVGALALGAAWSGGRRLGAVMAAMEAEQAAKQALIDQVSELIVQRAREVALLNQMSGLLQACHTVQEAAAVVGRLGAQFFPDEAGACFVADPSRGLFERKSVWGTSAAEGPPIFGGEDCWALRRGQPYLVPDTASGLVCAHLGAPAHTVTLCIPLMVQAEALGVLHLAGRSRDAAGRDAERPGLSETTQRLAAAVAEHLALSLANLRLRETLRAQSIRDPLTGLFNRRYMEETLERELRRAERNGQSVGLVLVDVDHFKQINDTFGHDAGDAVLAALGGFLRGHVRAGDIACRHGGEEFVLTLPGASLAETRRRAEELREAARDLQVPHRGTPIGPVTCSMGVSAFPDHGTTGEALLLAADGALYRAKHDGRNQVVVAE